MKNSPKFSETTKRILAKMAGERCSICEELTSLPNKYRTNFINKGEAAHIYGVNPAANNRYKKELTNIELKHISNGIWLCNNCHKHIDSDDSDFTVQKLFNIKEEHFKRVVGGKYGKSSFVKIDHLNSQINKLQNQIIDKQKIIEKDEILYNYELNKLKIEKEQLTHEKDILFNSYKSIIQITKGIDVEVTDNIIDLVFQKNELDQALELMSEDELNRKEFEVAKKRILKAEIFKLKKDYKNTLLNYQKAFEINQSFEIASFFIRYLKSIKSNTKLIEVLEKAILKEKIPERRLLLEGSLGQLYSEIDPDKSIVTFGKCLEIIEKKLKSNSHYLFYKTGYINYLAIAHKNKGNLNEALKQCEKSLKIYLTGKVEGETREDSFVEFCSLYNTIAQIYELNSNVNEALKYYSLALKICEEQLPNNLDLRATTILNMINCSTAMNFKETIDLMNKALNIIKILAEEKPLDYFEMLIGAYCKKSDLLFFMGKIEDSKKELNNAEKILGLALKINKEGFSLVEANFLNRKAIIYLSGGEKEKALKLIKTSIELYKASKVMNREVCSKMATLLFLKSNLHSDISRKIKDLTEAKSHLKKFSNKFSSDILLLKRIDVELKCCLTFSKAH